MSNPYIGEIRIVPYNFAPQGWLDCSGQLLPISQFEALFQLIGTTYGGDGETTFALPNLQSRTTIHADASNPIGSMMGVESVTLTMQQIPAHSHVVAARAASGDQTNPGQGKYATLASASRAEKIYGTSASGNAASNMVAITGGSQPHENMQPFTTLRFIIAVEGIFPPLP